MTNNAPERCSWCESADDYRAYHDNVWGRPVSDPQELFAKLCLDGQQAGLSWITILRKQAGYENAFLNFNPQAIVAMSDEDKEAYIYNNCDGGIICKEGTQFYDMWKYLRLLIHTMEFSIGIGRLIKILIFDANTSKVIGLASIASDVISIGVRDNWIGWTKEDKFEKSKLNQTCIGSTIVPTQPFGYNFLGGKLIASLLCTNDVRDAWEKKFNQKLVGMTTTSLYGGHSMYQRIPFWKTLN